MSVTTMLTVGNMGTRVAISQMAQVGVASSVSCSLNNNACSAAMRVNPLPCKQDKLWVSKLRKQQQEQQQKDQTKKKNQQKSLMICASSTGGRELYQPFRPPPTLVSSTPAGAATIEQQLEVLRDRQGLWYAYATVIPALSRAGFTPSEIDESTGLSGHEQNQLVVGAQVRDSLIATGLDKNSVSWFDVGGEECLYELRTLSALQRKEAALFVIERNMDPKLVRDLARSMKDFARRKNSEGFSEFTTAPGDCLAFALYRQSKETSNAGEIESTLNKAQEFAVTERAKAKILRALGVSEEVTVQPEVAKIKVLVMRLSSEKIPVVLPVAEFSAKALEQAPASPAIAPGSSGNFNITNTDTPWKSWIAIPSWRPITYAVSPVALLVPDATVLPKHTGIELRKDCPILVVVDKGDIEISDDNYFLVVPPEGGLTLQPGSRILSGQTVLGKILITLKPPLPIDPNINPDWDA